MRQDHGTRTEVDAGRYARAYADDDRYADYEPEADARATRTAPPRTLVDDVSAALACSGASRHWRKDVRETAPRVAAFRLDDGDDADRLAQWFAHEALQTRVIDHAGQPFMYVRRGPKIPRPDPWVGVTSATDLAGLDPWFAQDTADRDAERAAKSRGHVA